MCVRERERGREREREREGGREGGREGEMERDGKGCIYNRPMKGTGILTTIQPSSQDITCMEGGT